MKKEDLRIVFMGTPDFAVPSLEILLKNNYTVVGVITAPDKPAGRGLQLHESPIKKFALEHNLFLMQPSNLKDENFLQQLTSLNANLQIVVAFRMLPQVVWQMPSLGTFNLHGSLLPQYRGAAPINWAVINGETETGVTTFFLQHEIDTGKIIHQATCSIHENETAGNIHDKLMLIGADLVLKTVNDIAGESIVAVEQNQITTKQALRTAPKISKQDCSIDWKNNCAAIYNKMRGLNPFPTAWAEFANANNETISVKLFECKKEIIAHTLIAGTIVTDNKLFLKIACNDGFIEIVKLQLAGKKSMSTLEFLRGFQFKTEWFAKESQM